MAERIVLDANVLYRPSLRHPLLRMADRGFFEIVWTEKLVDEATRKPLASGRMSPEAYDYLWSKLVQDNASGFVSRQDVVDNEGHMPNHWKDRHVTAAALAGGAGIIVHDDRRGFDGIEALGLRAVRVNDYLREWLDRRSDETLEVLEEVAATDFREPMTVDRLLRKIAVARAPRFAAGARVLLLSDPPARGLHRLGRQRRPRDESGFLALYVYIETMAERARLVCRKCGGSHYIERYKKIDAGRCWNCLGPPGKRKGLARRS